MTLSQLSDTEYVICNEMIFPIPFIEMRRLILVSHDYGIKRNNPCESDLSCYGMWWALINVYILPLIGNFFLKHQDLVKILSLFVKLFQPLHVLLVRT